LFQSSSDNVGRHLPSYKCRTWEQKHIRFLKHCALSWVWDYRQSPEVYNPEWKLIMYLCTNLLCTIALYKKIYTLFKITQSRVMIISYRPNSHGNFSRTPHPILLVTLDIKMQVRHGFLIICCPLLVVCKECIKSHASLGHITEYFSKTKTNISGPTYVVKSLRTFIIYYLET
jgi:hypothetical protein